jgi:hypothetical protein
VSAIDCSHSTPTITPAAIIVVAPVSIPVTIVSRTWIAMVIGKRIPTDLIAEVDVDYKSHQSRPPPTTLAIVLASRSPGPVVVVIDPAAIVIGRPAPWLMTYPGPAIGRTPGPLAISIRYPIVVSSNGGCVWTPNPSVFTGV